MKFPGLTSIRTDSDAVNRWAEMIKSAFTQVGDAIDSLSMSLDNNIKALAKRVDAIEQAAPVTAPASDTKAQTVTTVVKTVTDTSALEGVTERVITAERTLAGVDAAAKATDKHLRDLEKIVLEGGASRGAWRGPVSMGLDQSGPRVGSDVPGFGQYAGWSDDVAAWAILYVILGSPGSGYSIKPWGSFPNTFLVGGDMVGIYASGMRAGPYPGSPEVPYESFTTGVWTGTAWMTTVVFYR